MATITTIWPPEPEPPPPVYDMDVILLQNMLADIPRDDPRRPGHHFLLAAQFDFCYGTSNNLATLQSAISHFEDGLAINHVEEDLTINHFELFATDLDEDILHVPWIHGRLSYLLKKRYEALHDPHDINTALQYAQLALANLAEDERPTNLAHLSLVLKDRYDLLRNTSDLDAAIQYSQEVLILMPDEQVHRMSLAGQFFARFLHLEIRSDLDQAILCLCLVMRGIREGNFPFDDPGSLFNTLGEYVYLRYLKYDTQEDLEASILNADIALLFTPPGHLNYPIVLDNLSAQSRSLYDQLHVLSDLDKSIAYAEKALLYSEINFDRNTTSIRLREGYKLRYDLNKDLDDLHTAIYYAETLIRIPPTHTDYGLRLLELSVLLRTRFTELADPNDAEMAVAYDDEATNYYQDALLRVPQIQRRLIFGTLSTIFYDRSERHGPLSDLDKAIEYAKESLAEAAELPNTRGNILSALSRYFNARYKRLEVLGDLETAIHHGEAALTTFVVQDPNRAGILHILSTCLKARYLRIRAQSDIEAAIKHAEASVAETPVNSNARGERLRNLSYLLSYRYHRNPVPGNLTAIIECSEEALAKTPLDSWTRPRILTVLANNIRFRYNALGVVEDIEAAVNSARLAHSFIPPDHMDRRPSCCNLGSMLRTNYPASGRLSDLDEAVDLGQESVAELPRDHFDRHNLLSHVGTSFWERFKATGSEEDRQQSLKYLLDAYDSPLASPLLRVVTARNIIKDFQSILTWDESSTLLEDAVQLIPIISQPFLGREDLQYLLSKLHGLPSDAASFALEAGRDASHALQLLELGRGIITGFGIDSRSELPELEATHPALFQLFTSLRASMNSFEGCEPPDIADEWKYHSNINFSSQRLQATMDMNLVLSEIRQIPGYERFLLLPLAVDFMQTVKDGGTIVVLNTTAIRSDAIIVRSSAITSLNLPKLSYAEAKERMQEMSQLVRGPRSSYPARTKKVKDFLCWLWNVVVEPVLGELQPNGFVQGEALPRIWWIGAGVLGSAPFHAAGRDHSVGSTSNTLNRVLSSYIPTIKALTFARQRTLTLRTKPDAHLLLVSMPTTPGQKALPGVEQEVQDIVAILANTGTTKTTVLSKPSSATVLGQLHLYDAVHFACHGQTDSSNPSNSSLQLLSSNTLQGTADKLTAQLISRVDTKNSQLAYLSACNTADNPATELADETIHLASAFQLAGFNHVVATMWVSQDFACVAIAKVFYTLLFDGQLDASDDEHRKVSEALHEATKRLRDTAPDKVLIWAPYIHTGA